MAVSPRGGAWACLLSLAAVPWLTLVSVLLGAIGVGMFDDRARAALQHANEASHIIAGDGMHEWTQLALRCLTAVTVVRAAGRARAALRCITLRALRCNAVRGTAWR